MKILNWLFPFSLLLCISVFLYNCSGCSQSGISDKNRGAAINNHHSTFKNRGKTIVKMVQIGGVYQIPVDVNGVRMSFIFDTGASNISISTTEAMFLAKQGLLSKEDIIGSQKYMDANGDISEGTVINLKTIKIGDRVLNNIEAGVVDNLNAPLLFGQSALSKFGKISIDNKRGEITFE